MGDGESISDPRRKTRHRVRELLEQGVPIRDIAGELGLTSQRIYQHRKAIERERRMRGETA